MIRSDILIGERNVLVLTKVNEKMVTMELDGQGCTRRRGVVRTKDKVFGVGIILKLRICLPQLPDR